MVQVVMPLDPMEETEELETVITAVLLVEVDLVEETQTEEMDLLEQYSLLMKYKVHLVR